MVVDAASHGIIDPGSKADIRPAYQPPLPSPRLSPTLVARRRSLVPATRGLRRWDQPFESSSIIELDKEPHRGVHRTLIRLLLSHIPRHCRLSCIPVYSVGSASSFILGTNFRGSRIEAPSKPHVRHTTHSLPVRVLWFYAYTFFLLLFYVNQHRPIHHDLFCLGIFVCSIISSLLMSFDDFTLWFPLSKEI